MTPTYLHVSALTPSAAFTARLENWIRWCKSFGSGAGRAGSAEGGYRSGQIWEPEPLRGAEVDIVDAELVNRAYSQIGGYERRVIKVVFFRGWWRDQWKAQKLGCRVDKLAAVCVAAIGVLEARVAFLEGRAYSARTVDPVEKPREGLLSL